MCIRDRLTSTSHKSSKFLYWLLLAIIGLTVWVASQDIGQGLVSENVVGVREVGLQSSRRSSEKVDKSQQTLDLLLPNTESIVPKMFMREPQKRQIKKLFKTHSWHVAPPVRKVEITSHALLAPPLPFKYNGKLEGMPEGTVVFLVANEKLYTTAIGENVTAQWRLDAETQDDLQFTYLPLGLPKILSKSDSVVSNFAAESRAALLLKPLKTK